MSRRNSLRAWRSLAAILVIGWVGTSLLPASRPERSINVVEAVSPATAQPVNPQSVLVLQQTIRDRGVDALPRIVVPAVARI